MKQTIGFLLFCVLLLVVTQANAEGNGCAWSGCTHSSSVCSTGGTGGSGRPTKHGGKRCRWFGKEEFCCDTDCKYQPCGRSCQYLNMKAYPEKETTMCSFTIPGFGTFQGTSQFCCP